MPANGWYSARIAAPGPDLQRHGGRFRPAPQRDRRDGRHLLPCHLRLRDRPGSSQDRHGGDGHDGDGRGNMNGNGHDLFSPLHDERTRGCETPRGLSGHREERRTARSGRAVANCDRGALIGRQPRHRRSLDGWQRYEFDRRRKQRRRVRQPQATVVKSGRAGRNRCRAVVVIGALGIGACRTAEDEPRQTGPTVPQGRGVRQRLYEVERDGQQGKEQRARLQERATRGAHPSTCAADSPVL